MPIKEARLLGLTGFFASACSSTLLRRSIADLKYSQKARLFCVPLPVLTENLPYSIMLTLHFSPLLSKLSEPEISERTSDSSPEFSSCLSISNMFCSDLESVLLENPKFL